MLYDMTVTYRCHSVSLKEHFDISKISEKSHAVFIEQKSEFMEGKERLCSYLTIAVLVQGI